MVMAKKNYAVLISVVLVCLILFICPVYGQEAAQDSGEEQQERLSKEAQTAMVEAQRAFEQKDLVTARKLIIDYLATNPVDAPPEAYLLLGYYWHSDGKLDEATKVFKEGHQKFPAHLDILSYYSATLYENGKFAEAAPLLEKYYDASTKKDLKMLEAAASAYYQIEKFTDAKRVIRKMMSTTKEPQENWYNMLLGISFEEEKYDEAEKILFEALKLFPMNADYWQQLGMVRQTKEDWFGMAGAMEVRSNVKPPEKTAEFREMYNVYSSLNLPLRVFKSLEMSA